MECAERSADQRLALAQAILLGLALAGPMATAASNDDGCNVHNVLYLIHSVRVQLRCNKQLVRGLKHD